jgi:hypothetical protein
MLRLGKRAQTTAEYAILIALVVGAVVAMQVYVKRGIQGRVRDVVDHTGTGGEVAGENLTLSGSQYEPYYLSRTGNTAQSATNTENVGQAGATARTSTTTTTGTQTQTMGWQGEEGQENP